MSQEGEFSGSLHKYCQREGLLKASSPVSQTPAYIVRCQHKAQVLQHKAAILARLAEVNPKKRRQVDRDGFEPLVMEMTDIKYKNFTAVIETHGIVEAYLTVLLHGFHYKPALPSGPGLPNP